MGLEIERRFLVTSSDWKPEATSSYRIQQAYLAANQSIALRIRIKDGSTALLTIKSAGPGIERAEFEYPIPIKDAEQLCQYKTGHLIEKCRYAVPAPWGSWEIDVFSGDLAGLVIAEIELDTKDRHFSRPVWLGREITDDARYSNASLALAGIPQDHPAQLDPNE